IGKVFIRSPIARTCLCLCAQDRKLSDLCFRQNNCHLSCLPDEIKYANNFQINFWPIFAVQRTKTNINLQPMPPQKMGTASTCWIGLIAVHDRRPARERFLLHGHVIFSKAIGPTGALSNFDFFKLWPEYN